VYLLDVLLKMLLFILLLHALCPGWVLSLMLDRRCGSLKMLFGTRPHGHRPRLCSFVTSTPNSLTNTTAKRSVCRLRQRSTQELVIDRAPRMVFFHNRRLLLCRFRSSNVSWRILGGAEFHFLVRILLRIVREELSPFVTSFNRYEVSFVLPFRDHHWRFRSYSPSGISCRQWPLVVCLFVTLLSYTLSVVIVHVVCYRTRCLTQFVPDGSPFKSTTLLVSRYVIPHVYH
jgi:hypothetical protein